MSALGIKLIVSAAIVAALAGGFAMVRQHYINVGHDRAMAAVEAVNKGVADEVRQGLDRIHACRDAGGLWNQSLRHCDRRL